MSSEYPDYYPPFLRDFHDQKNVAKAFYHWLDFMDNRQEIDYGREVRERRSDMANWREFHILLVSFLDFLFQFGYQVQRTRRAGEYADTKYIDTMAHFGELYHSVVNPTELLAYPPDHTMRLMLEWQGWIPYMPKEVREAWDNMPIWKDYFSDTAAAAPEEAV